MALTADMLQQMGAICLSISITLIFGCGDSDEGFMTDDGAERTCERSSESLSVGSGPADTEGDQTFDRIASFEGDGWAVLQAPANRKRWRGQVDDGVLPENYAAFDLVLAYRSEGIWEKTAVAEQANRGEGLDFTLALSPTKPKLEKEAADPAINWSRLLKAIPEVKQNKFHFEHTPVPNAELLGLPLTRPVVVDLLLVRDGKTALLGTVSGLQQVELLVLER